MRVERLPRALARGLWGFVVFAGVTAGAGCSGGKPSGAVAGRVTYNGSPVTTGDVNFLSKGGAAAQAKLNDAGEYKLAGELEAGEYAVYVSPPVPEPQAPGSKPTPPRKFEVPAKFRDPTSSGVTVTVKSGRNEVPVEFQN